ncbi:hypothetical protein H1C71_021309 [Ictidomys tridecemlineatus]|nr:hypothetical protein H1C71_021309 [Ictidomys tridecemlineatus]KAG3268316.1 hypothetical protein H1C71_021309 [Ictidomys tridecemlineatus]KAG3268317.1 hypothetical protein H1C71_021309 [Ictidomys tridecemlineatus]KAG3268318.1 hypothetical protein H1C71_021309 [Ictidomys tridecemlineatus]KAG3268319.1 hypothetical protein H1C71_021309 [Ictidomys tridecemlineatus]
MQIPGGGSGAGSSLSLQGPRSWGWVGGLWVQPHPDSPGQTRMAFTSALPTLPSQPSPSYGSICPPDSSQPGLFQFSTWVTVLLHFQLMSSGAGGPSSCFLFLRLPLLTSSPEHLPNILPALIP